MIRTHDKELKENETEPWFVGDGPGNGTRVKCSSCGEISIIVGVESKKEAQCGNPKCKKYFVYRPWWEW